MKRTGCILQKKIKNLSEHNRFPPRHLNGGEGSTFLKKCITLTSTGLFCFGLAFFLTVFFNKTHMESITGLKTLDSQEDFDTHPMLTFFSFYLRKTTELAIHTLDI